MLAPSRFCPTNSTPGRRMGRAGSTARAALALLALAALAPLAAQAAAGAASGETDAVLLRRIETFVGEEMHREGVPGVAIGIARGDEVLLAQGFGDANVELHAPADAHSLFQSGSVGKQFTSVALMLQVEAGRLKLEDPITQYFTDAPPSWRKITIRHLLTHTSGIADYEDDSSDSRLDAPLIDLRHDYTEDELRQLTYRLPLQFEAGTRWKYSNTGYLLLGLLIHQVSGEFYGDVLKERVFEPLGMRSARIISEADIVEGRTAGYRRVGGALKNQEWVSPALNTTADGSLYLSIADMMAWDRGLRARAILKPESWTQIYAPAHLASGKSYPYGFGWEVDSARGAPWYHHSGSWQGFRTYISRYLADDLSIVVLCNLAEAEPERFVDGIAALIDPALERIRPSAPIADREPAITRRARKILLDAQSGALRDQDFSYLGSSFEALARARQQLLAPLGAPRRLALVARRDLGDDREYVYVVEFPTATLRLDLELRPDGRVAVFDLEPE